VAYGLNATGVSLTKRLSIRNEEPMISLRPYQVRFTQVINSALREFRRVIGVAATGSGKAVMIGWYGARVLEKGRRILVVTDRRIVVDQLADTCRKMQLSVGVIMADTPTNPDAPAQVASIHTLQRRGFQDLPLAAWVIVDESHQMNAAYRRLFAHYPDAIWLGMTATPVGPAGKSLIGPLWRKWVEPIKNSQLLADGFILRTKCIAPFEPDLSKDVKFSGGEYSRAWVATRMEELIIFADVFEWWRPYCHLPTVCFAPKVVYARGIAKEFQRRGYTAEVITADTERTERLRLFERFAAGDLRVLCSVSVLREGWDLPAATVGIDLTPCYQLRTFLQKVGRIRRPAPGKEHAIWLDFSGNVWRHIHPDEDPLWPDKPDVTTRDLVKQRKNESPPEPWSCPACAYTLSPWERPTKLDGGALACPNCGKEMAPAMRRIVMGKGKMRTVTVQQRQKKVVNDDVRRWFQCIYPAMYTGRTLNFARAMFKESTGRWPDPDKLPFCPKERDSGDWNRRVREVYPQLDKRKKNRR